MLKVEGRRTRGNDIAAIGKVKWFGRLLKVLQARQEATVTPCGVARSCKGLTVFGFAA